MCHTSRQASAAQKLTPNHKWSWGATSSPHRPVDKPVRSLHCATTQCRLPHSSLTGTPGSWVVTRKHTRADSLPGLDDMCASMTCTQQAEQDADSIIQNAPAYQSLVICDRGAGRGEDALQECSVVKSVRTLSAHLHNHAGVLSSCYETRK